MLWYQTVCYYGLKRVGVRDWEDSYNGLSVYIYLQLCYIMKILCY